jgi:malonyl-CoA O-methyltransferase
MNKQKIIRNFSRASNSYDEAAYIQRECAKILVSNLSEYYDFYPDSILDIGTGTGYIPEILLKTFPKAEYTLNDISSSMIEFNKAKFELYKNFNYCLGDMETMEVTSHDLIITNFALQWTDDLEKTIKKLYSKANILAFSCLLYGTFKEWENITKSYCINAPIKEYPSERELEEMLIYLKPRNYNFKRRRMEIKFPNVASFLNYLKNLGANSEKENIPFSELKNIIQNNDDTFSTSYDVFFAILERH